MGTACRPGSPTGEGKTIVANRSTTDDEDYVPARRQMVEGQLRGRGIRDRRVLQAMAAVPREEFVPAAMRHAAYRDAALPIGFGQTISQPFTVAFMCEALRLQGTEKVLEIGAGSGYSAAVLSLLCGEVHTVERIPELAELARERLRRLGYENARVYAADGTLGLPAAAPYDGIVVTAGAPALPPQYASQLAEGGRIVIPMGPLPTSQEMCRFTRRGDDLEREELGSFAFVPLIGAAGWGEDASSLW